MYIPSVTVSVCKLFEFVIRRISIHVRLSTSLKMAMAETSILTVSYILTIIELTMWLATDSYNG